MRRVSLLAIGIVLTGLNLRTAVASVPPLLDDLERDPGMSSTAAGVLTSLPVLSFGVLALAAAPLARRFGGERTLLGVLVAIAAGTLLRAAGPVGALFAGTAVAAAGVAIGNVLVPAVIKGRFPHRIGLLMGLYTAILGAGAALAGGLAVPAADALGWRGSLALWAVPAAVALAVTVPAVRRDRGQAAVRGGVGGLRTLLRDRVAWQVTLYMGVQSSVFYSGLAWLPSILRDHGFRPSTAGALLSVYAFVGIPSSLVAPVIAARRADQRTMVGASVVLEAIPLAGLLAAPGLAVLWVALLAFGQGAAFSLALTLIVLRSPDPRRGAELSGMAQAAGYCIAALGPFLVGVLHDAEGGWTAPLLFMLALCVPMFAAGVGAGRARLVSDGRLADLPLVP